jgi:hypothetical protein
VKTVVTTRPRLADLAALEDDDVLAGTLKHRRTSEAGRSRSDHGDHATVLHDGRVPVEARYFILPDEGRRRLTRGGGRQRTAYVLRGSAAAYVPSSRVNVACSLRAASASTISGRCAGASTSA